MPDTNFGAMSKVSIAVNTLERKQNKSIDIEANGSYQVNAEIQGYEEPQETQAIGFALPEEEYYYDDGEEENKK